MRSASGGWGVSLVLVVVQVLFGVNYIASKIVVTAVPPLPWASVRAVIAGGILAAAAIGLKRTPPTDGRRFFLPLIVYSMLGVTINQGCFLVGLRHTTPANSAVLTTLIPVFTVLIGTVRGEERLTARRLAGFACAFGGALALMKVENLSVSHKTLLGDLLTVVNSASYALFLSIAADFIQHHDRVWTTAWLFLYGGMGLGIAAAPEWTDFHPLALTPRVLACMAFAIFGGTVLTYGLSLWALMRTRASSVASFIYLQPVVASLLAWIWLGQRPSARNGVATLAILTGLLLARHWPLRRAASEAGREPIGTSRAGD